MRVIENNDTIQATCPHCKSVLAVEISDVRWNEIPHHCSEFEISCGVCDRSFGVNIPKSWISKIVPNDM